MSPADLAPGDLKPASTTRHRTARLAGACLVVAIGLLWFNPVFRGLSFSTVGGHQNAVYPWRSSPNLLPDPPQSDQADLNYPWQSLLQRSLRSGAIPWWNADSFGGQPFFANGSSSILYPPRLATALTLSPTASHDALSIFHVVLAGVFTYLLLADLGLGTVAAIFGAVAWMLGSFTLAWAQLEVVTPLFTFLPLGFLTIRRALLMSRRWVAAAAVTIALLLISAHILLAGIAAAAIGGYGLCLFLSKVPADFREDRWGGIARRALRLVGSGVLGLGLAGFVVVPTLALIGYVSRQSFTYSELTKAFLLAPSKLRYAFTAPPLPVTADVMHQAAFVGTLAAALAIVGVFQRRRGSGLGRGLVIVSALIAIGGPLTWLAYHLVPGMNVFRPYSRLLFVFDFGVAALGAIGLDALIRWAPRGRVRPAGDHSHRPQRRSGDSGQYRRVFSLVGLIVVGLNTAQLGTYGRKLNAQFEPANSAYQYPLTPLLRALGPRGTTSVGWPDRLLSIRDGPDQPMLYSAEPLVFGIDSAGGYDSSVPTRTVDIWRVVAGEQPPAVIRTKLAGAYQPAFSVGATRYDLLARLGVDRIALTPAAVKDVRAPLSAILARGWKVVYSGKDGTVLAGTGPSTGPVVVHKAVVANTDAEALDLFSDPGFDYLHSAIIARSGSVPGPVTGSTEVSDDTVLSAKRSVNTSTISVRTAAPGWLVIPDMWDPGWTATVNGHKRPVLRANYAEQAVAIPAGTVTIHLAYRPVGLVTGVAISALALLGCALLIVYPTRRRTDVIGDEVQQTLGDYDSGSGNLTP